VRIFVFALLAFTLSAFGHAQAPAMKNVGETKLAVPTPALADDANNRIVIEFQSFQLAQTAFQQALSAVQSAWAEYTASCADELKKAGFQITMTCQVQNKKVSVVPINPPPAGTGATTPANGK
jgi:hypothetical protein